MPLFRLERAQADLHGELAPVLAEAVEFETGSHGPNFRIGEEAVAVSGVAIPESRGDEDFDELAHELRPGVTEELLRLGIDQDDLPFPVDDHDGVGRGLQKPFEFGLGFLSLRDVPDGRRDERHAFLGLHRRQADFGRELRPILAAAAQIDAHAHRTALGIAEVTAPVRRMSPAEALGDQDFNRLAQEVFALVAEQLFRLAVDQHDLSVLADDDHGVRSRFQKPAQADVVRPLFLEAFQQGDVLYMGGQEAGGTLPDRHRSHGDGNGDGGAAFFLPEAFQSRASSLSYSKRDLAPRFQNRILPSTSTATSASGDSSARISPSGGKSCLSLECPMSMARHSDLTTYPVHAGTQVRPADRFQTVDLEYEFMWVRPEHGDGNGWRVR